MGGESKGIGRSIAIAAAIEAALVLLWIVAFASVGAPSRWYVEVPLAFLLIPVLGLASGIYLLRRNTSEHAACFALAVFWILLALNLIAFLGYAAASGAGV